MYNKYAKLRDEKGLTDYAVAKETGISTATMSSWRNGVYTPKADKLLTIAEFFGVPLEYFLKEDA
ncbi:MAG: helix-turn-helix transcriptional regulator [Lachnospiraceae bacterium]|nr:helix-turn-helix transcriptional regulator [Lachnospiraceae bacterium]